MQGSNDVDGLGLYRPTVQFAQNDPFGKLVKRLEGEIDFLSHRLLLQLPKAICFLEAPTLLHTVSKILIRGRFDTLK